MKDIYIKAGSEFLIRDASAEDASAILDIYSPYITDTPVTFETEVPSAEQFRKRMESVTEAYPWLVAEKGGVIAGYAYASKHRERAAYRWSVDFAVYLAPEFYGLGLGSRFYSELISIVKTLGYYNAFGIITLPNDKSVKLHESAGFIKAGHVKSSGYKLGRWHDTGYWQLKLRDYRESPEEPLMYNLFKTCNTQQTDNLFCLRKK